MSRLHSIVLRLAIPVLALAACGGDATEQLAGELRRVVADSTAPAYAKSVRWKVVQAIYADRSYEPMWVGADRPTERARDLVTAVASAETHGMRVRDYGLAGLATSLERAYGKGKAAPAELTELELRLTALYLDYGGDLVAGRIDPNVVDKGWYARTRRAAADSLLRVAAEAETFEAMAEQLLPQQPEYDALVTALARLRAVAAGGGWPAVPAGGTLKRGSSGARVAALRARLVASADLDSAAATGESYDSAMSAAVARFRARHGLEPKDQVDGEMLAALNVPVDRRIRQIELNLERLRWLPNAFGERYILVNIPEYRLTAYEGGKEMLAMRVVVGKEYGSATPVFADTMSYVVFRPYWNVPTSIRNEEIIPKVRDNERWLEASGYEVVKSGRDTTPIDPGSIDWDADTTDFPYLIRQKPGPTNSLGRVKFMFPNQFDIYLHDTPARHLFARNDRAFSHGCIRLEHPDQLARYVLRGDPKWTDEAIDEAMSAETPTQVTLKQGIPVYILYLTAFARNGAVNFRDDLYGTDARAIAKIGPPEPNASIVAVREALDKLMKG